MRLRKITMKKSAMVNGLLFRQDILCRAITPYFGSFYTYCLYDIDYNAVFILGYEDDTRNSHFKHQVGLR